MSSALQADKPAGNEAVGLGEWTRPIVRHLAAGCAEDDSGPNTDAIINPS